MVKNKFHMLHWFGTYDTIPSVDRELDRGIFILTVFSGPDSGAG